MSRLPHISTHPDKVVKTSWKQYGIRFLFGGVITTVVGILAKAFGPVIAGLFLAFPAILPAGLTLIARDEGRGAAGAECVGSVFGSIGLIPFALVIWLLGPRLGGAVSIALAGICWLAASVLAWLLFQIYRRKLRPVLTMHFGSPYNRSAVGRGQAVRQRTLDPRS